MATATLNTTVNVMWEDYKGVEHDCDVDVTYTYNGADDLQVLAADAQGEPYGIDERSFDDLVDQAVFERADDDYADWLSGQDGSDD